MSRSMKIAFLNIYNGVVNRGAETFVKELASRLANKYEITVFQSGEPMGNGKYKIVRLPVNWNWNKKSGVGTLAARFFMDYWNRKIFVFAFKAAPKILKEKFDIVVPVNGGWLPAVMRIVTWLYGGKMVISGQSGIGWDDRNNLWCFPDYFIALSVFARNWAKKANLFVKVEYISNGVDTNKFTFSGKAIKTKLKKPIVLCAGALTKTKRIDLAIRAVAKLKNVDLLVCGDGDLRSEIYDLGSKILRDRFQLIKVSYEDMPKVYRVANVFTLPSESYYSFENVLVEAMATNLPVVANDDPIRREIVGDAGILVNPTDTNAYAQVLKKALDTDWGNKPQKQARKFDWDKIALEYEKIIRSL